LKQDIGVTGTFFLSWPANVIWPLTEIRGPQIVCGGTTIVEITTVDGGRNWLGTYKSYLYNGPPAPYIGPSLYTYQQAYVEPVSPNDQAWWVGSNKYLTYLYLYENIADQTTPMRGKKLRFKSGGYGIVSSYLQSDPSSPWDLSENSVPIVAILTVVMPINISGTEVTYFRITDEVVASTDVLCCFPSPPGTGWTSGVNLTEYPNYSIDDPTGTFTFAFGNSSLNPNFPLPLPININESLTFAFTQSSPPSYTENMRQITTISLSTWATNRWEYNYSPPDPPNTDGDISTFWFPVSNDSV
jgi:hypothetical protein